MTTILTSNELSILFGLAAITAGIMLITRGIENAKLAADRRRREIRRICDRVTER
jgi:hypothetical protein